MEKGSGPLEAGGGQRAAGNGQPSAISRGFDAILAAIGDWLDGPSRTPLPDPGASRRRS